MAPIRLILLGGACALVGLQQPLLKETRLTGTITAAAFAEQAAENEAGNQAGQHTSDEEKDWGHEGIGILQSNWLIWP